MSIRTPKIHYYILGVFTTVRDLRLLAIRFSRFQAGTHRMFGFVIANFQASHYSLTMVVSVNSEDRLVSTTYCYE